MELSFHDFSLPGSAKQTSQQRRYKSIHSIKEEKYESIHAIYIRTYFDTFIEKPLFPLEPYQYFMNADIMLDKDPVQQAWLQIHPGAHSRGLSEVVRETLLFYTALTLKMDFATN